MDTELWLGSLSLYKALLSRQEAFNAAMLAGTLSCPEDDSEDPEPENFSLFGNVGVIDISGALTNDDSWWTRWSGDTSYNQIRRSLIEAATHSSVKCIVMNIDSGGGTPNGLADVGDMVRQISASGVKVYAYSGGMMASAAYWLGASADKVYCGETADVGSIGVISISKEYTEMMKKDGIKVTVVRAGEEKALANPYEKLTDKAKAGIQTRIDALYDVFVNRIAEYRSVPADYVRQNMANGKEFIGQQALEAGLVDGITTLDDLITGLQSKLDKQTAGKETSMARKSTVLTQAQRDAMLEGVAPTDALEIVDPAAEVEAPAGDEPKLDGTQEADPKLDATPAPTETNLVEFLRSELSTKDKTIIELSSQVKDLQSKVTAMEAVHGSMKQLVAISISRMQVALGAPAMDVSDMPAELVLAQHAKVTETFCKRFPVGGVAAVEVDDTPNTPASVSPVNNARLRQTKI